MNEEIERPKDLQVKFGTKLEAFWTRVRKCAEQDMEDARNSILLNEELVRISAFKIKEIEEENKLDHKEFCGCAVCKGDND